MFARAMEMGKWGVTTNGNGDSLGDDENVLESDSSDDCTTL